MRGFFLPGFHDHHTNLWEIDLWERACSLPQVWLPRKKWGCLQHEIFFMKAPLRPNAAHRLACRMAAISMKTS
ncbi:hypothetical protein DZG01_17900 [Pseudomonas fluorescens]|nr:hypothetical protein DZG01_17900 [Pseudomonas fluorescens]